MPTWISKQQAADALHTSKRTIERHIAAGKIQTLRLPRAGRSPETMCHASDIEALQPQAFLIPQPPAETAALTPRPPGPDARDNQHLQEIAETIAASITTLATIATRARDEAGSDIARRPWLTLDEAVARSGLSRRLIRNLITRQEVLAVKDGRQWKVQTESLTGWKPASARAWTRTARSKSITAKPDHD